MARRNIKRASNWTLLSFEARALIAEGERDGLAWGYVALSCGGAAQRCAFGVAASVPDLFDIVTQEPPIPRDVAQMSLFPPDSA
jgi:hypothetical protein